MMNKIINLWFFFLHPKLFTHFAVDIYFFTTEMSFLLELLKGSA